MAGCERNVVGMETPGRSVRLSKSKFQTGLKCPLALWLSVHERDLADPRGYASQRRLESGTAIGRLAQSRWPSGVEIEAGFMQPQEALRQTREALDAGAEALFEAAFEYRDVLVRVDVLERGPRGWNIVEVKSSTRVKDEYITDVAVQKWVLEGAGLPVSVASIMHIDNTYVWDGARDAAGRPAYDPAGLFEIEDVTIPAEEFEPQVAALVDDFLEMLRGPGRPAVTIGSHCKTPYVCDFKGVCHSALPERWPITALPYVTADQLDRLVAEGVLNVLDIPDGFPLQPRQEERIRPMITGEAEVRRDPRATFAGWEFPLLFLDFEDFNPALPLFPGTRPYQPGIPFQYSLHVLGEDGTVEHRGYLHTDASDPRPPWAERLLSDLGERGTIVHYTAHEPTVLGKVAEAVPELAERLLALRPRLADLERIVAQCVGHPDFAGRTSIKHVLPALVRGGGPTYKGKRIANGEDAPAYYLDAVTGALSAEEAADVFADLEEYCKTDTEAMLEVYRVLAGVREVDGRLVLP